MISGLRMPRLRSENGVGPSEAQPMERESGDLSTSELEIVAVEEHSDDESTQSTDSE